MKAPDKIVMPEAASQLRFTMTESVEYIRKDALLEWAKDLKHVYEVPVNNHEASKICRTKAEAFQMIIEKIESL